MTRRLETLAAEYDRLLDQTNPSHGVGMLLLINARKRFESQARRDGWQKFTLPSWEDPTITFNLWVHPGWLKGFDPARWDYLPRETRILIDDAWLDRR